MSAAAQVPVLQASATAAVSAFVCPNCARGPIIRTSAGHPPPQVLPIKWPARVHEISVPCTGKLQPEHILKAFESGADLVCVFACAKDNCHYLEGSRRLQKRVQYVRGLLDELGVGGQRLLVFDLPGSAKEDAQASLEVGRASLPAKVAEAGTEARPTTAERFNQISQQIAEKLKTLGPSPLHR
ncbi:MAG TPA: hydrogenase iron-sulfur subunit [Planctomycetota bacterium]|jgi:coenzyme F420-reducing hydrogenase delta subunit